MGPCKSKEGVSDIQKKNKDKVLNVIYLDRQAVVRVRKDRSLRTNSVLVMSQLAICSEQL